MTPDVALHVGGALVCYVVSWDEELSPGLICIDNGSCLVAGVVCEEPKDGLYLC